MSRLEGRQSNAAAWIILLIVIIVAAAVVALDFLGYVNLIPNFGPM